MPHSGSSIALWYDPKDDTQTEVPKVELHVNFWRFKPPFLGKSQCEGLVEFGFMVTDWYLVKNIKLSLPFNINAQSIEDIGYKFTDPDVATALFNKDLSVKNYPNVKYVDLLGASESIFTRVGWILQDGREQFADAHKYVITEDGRTQITIPGEKLADLTKDLKEDKKLYFRFRVNLDNNALSTFMETVRPDNHFLLSGYTKVECLDFRLNRIRNLPDLLQKSVTNNAFSLQKINFFVISRIEDELINAYESYRKARRLEEDLWNEYFGRECSSEVIYQWKEEAKSDDRHGLENFSIFVKFRKEHARTETIVPYLVFVAVLAIFQNIVGALGNWLYGIIGIKHFQLWIENLFRSTGG